MEAIIIEILNKRAMKGQHGEANMSFWDEKMRGHWNGLKIPPYIGPGPKLGKGNRETCVWKPPKNGWFKINFDGASRGNLGQDGIGCSLHNSDETVVARRAKPIGMETNNRAKSMALVEGLEMCMASGVEKLVVEGDLTIVINGMKKGSILNWRLDALLNRALNLSKAFKKIIFNHIFCEGNFKADQLANMGADGIYID
ncbi:uncharacterized protein LOC131027734 [Cryptomeria japonica]|uniref:uncharacterized protein LOC131027734 n=1 Tax=Cryptomeria japonica TaxID=3369 RepID=UPI0027D9D40D|nr:uncharacterized protein LOC131027734 [Cryptomeria japonica]